MYLYVHTNHSLCAETGFGPDAITWEGGGVCFEPDARLWPSGRLQHCMKSFSHAFKLSKETTAW